MIQLFKTPSPNISNIKNDKGETVLLLLLVCCVFEGTQRSFIHSFIIYFKVFRVSDITVSAGFSVEITRIGVRMKLSVWKLSNNCEKRTVLELVHPSLSDISSKYITLTCFPWTKFKRRHCITKLPTAIYVWYFIRKILSDSFLSRRHGTFKTAGITNK